MGENSVCRTTGNVLHAITGLLSVVPKPRKFVPNIEEYTCQVASCPTPTPDPNISMKTDKLGMSAVYFCLWFFGQATHFWICEYTVLFFSTLS
jgi:hypothetical protein